MTISHTSKLSMLATFVGGLLLASNVSAAINTNSPSLTLEEHIYFQTPSGEPTLVQRGSYDVQTAVFEHPGDSDRKLEEAWIRLTPEGGKNTDVILIQAKVASHEDHVTQSEAYLLPTPDNSNGMQSLMLWTPEGRAFEAVGSKTGIFTRGIGSWVKKAGGKIKGAARKTYRVGKGTYGKAKRYGKKVYSGAKRVAGKAMSLYNFVSNLDGPANMICKKAPSQMRGACTAAVKRALSKVTL